MAGLLSLLTGDFEISPKVAELIIAPLDDNGSIDNDLGGEKILQYWPESMNESSAANWQSTSPPGTILPIYQWISGSERTFSFTVVFSRDVNGEIGKGKDLEEDKFNVDVDAAIAWLYTLKTNDYKNLGDVGQVATAPPTLWVHLSGTKLGYNMNVPNELKANSENTGGIYCLLGEISVNRENWFTNGVTRYATVDLSFFETMQVGTGIYPYGRSDFLEQANLYKRRPSK
jgi:hypothetical protein